MGKQNTANKQLLDELECVQQRIIELARAEAECKKIVETLRESKKQYVLDSKEQVRRRNHGKSLNY